MNVCLIGDGLISLTLAKALINKKIKVFMYYRNNKKIPNESRTIGISSNNLNFIQKKIIKINKSHIWGINKIEIYNEQNKKEISQLRNLGMTWETSPSRLKIGDESLLKGKSFVLTGTLDGMTRGEAAEQIRALGGTVGISVSKKTDYVVAGISPGAKLLKAQELGIAIIDKDAFEELLKNSR